MEARGQDTRPTAIKLSQTKLKHESIGVIGSDMTARQYAILFASAGYDVRLYDADKSKLPSTMDGIRTLLETLRDNGYLRGSLTVDEQLQLIQPTDCLATCVKGAKYVQECAPEDMDSKRKILVELDVILDDNTAVGCTVFFELVSKVVDNMKHRTHILFVLNNEPMVYCELMEVTPTPFTEQRFKDVTMSLMTEVGQTPVLLKNEVLGGVRHRLQFALVAECLRLLADGTVTVAELETVMRNGLGLRYAFLGPMATLHLNADGIVNYADRYGELYNNIIATFGPSPRLDRQTAERIEAELADTIPVDKVAAWRAWRTTGIAEFVKHRKQHEQPH